MSPISRPVRRLLQIALGLIFTMGGGLRAAPYGEEGMPIEWTQPDGTKLKLRVFGDEFYARTETEDGYTVVYNPARKAYEYAKLSPSGKNIVPGGVLVNGKAPAGLAKKLKRPKEARHAIWKERYDRLAPNDRAEWARRVKAARQRKGLEAAEPGPLNDAGGGGVNQPSSPPAAAITGGYVGLTVLVQFPDDPATTTSDPTNFPTTKAAMESYCNQIGYTGGGNTGSVRDYFLAQSLNQTDYTQIVTEIVTLPQPRAYYNWSDYPTNSTLRDGGLTGRLVLNDAITILKAQGFDFTGLTRNGSKQVIATNVLFAGATSGVWPDGLWPHRWSLSPQVNVGTTQNPIYIYDYQITNAETSSVPIGTFCHENGHLLLKFPDLYDYGGESEGVGNHCLMGAGNHLNGGKTPGPINGYFKDICGWSNVVDITTSQFFTDALPTTNNEGYRIRKPGTSTEYFFIENRGTGDPWAAYSPDKGILIWHIDELVNGNDNEQMTASQHYEVSLEQADGAFDLENNRDRGDSADAFDSSHALGFSDSTLPDAKWWNGSNSGIRLAFLSAPGANMNVQFGLPANSVAVFHPNGGETFYFGSTQTIAWAANITGNVKIELLKGGSPHTVLSASEANDGSYAWTVSAGLPAGNDYTVKISSVDNPAYSDISNAGFTIMPQPTLADALDAPELAWTNSGNANWFPQSTTTKDGVDAAESGNITHSQSSSMETTLAGPGTMTFWWKVSSESGYDYLRFYLNNVEQTGSLAKISGTVDWVQKTVSIPSGSQTVKWSYTKDSSVDGGADTAWVDQVVYAPTNVPEIAVEQPVGTDLTDGSATINFGSVNTGSSGSPLLFTIRNTGTANLTGLALTKGGTHGADYLLGSLGTTTLAPGTSTTFTVTFTPGGSGTRTASIQIASNDANENPFDINLTGNGVGPGTLAITPAGGLSSSGGYGGSFSPASLVYTLSNPGNSTIDWTAANAQSWVTPSATGGTLAAGATTTVTVSINAAANTLDAGSYNDTVTFTNTTNGGGDTTRAVALTVNPAAATVTLGGLVGQVYDGWPKQVSVTTAPPGLSHSVTYAGQPAFPVNAGSYAVVATITDPNYQGSASGSLVIGKAAQTITFGSLPPVLDDAPPFGLTASASSGLAVSFTSSNPAVATVTGGTVTVVGLGSTTITAFQAGDTNYNAATAVPQTLTVVRSNPLAVPGGPYRILVGQSLSLDGNGSQPSYGETLNAHAWDLDNDGTFGDATGALVDVSYAELTTTWSRIPGINTIQLRVTDTAGKTSTVSTTLTLVTDLTWDANGPTAGQTNGAGAWLGANLWWDGTANTNWVAGSNAIFGGPATAGGAVTLASPTTVNAMTFNAFTGTYTLGTTGQAITLNGGIDKTAVSAAVTIASPVTLGGPQTWTNNSSGVLLLNDSTSSALSGTADLALNGAGRVSIVGTAAGSPGYTGNISITNGGELEVRSNTTATTGPLGTGNISINGGTLGLYFNNTLNRAIGNGPGQIQITGGVSGFTGNGATGSTFTISGMNWGTTEFNPDELVLQRSTANTDGKGTLAGSIDLGGGIRPIRSDQTGGNLVNGYGTFSGNISNGGIIKIGVGQHIFSGINTYAGGTTISQGTLRFGTRASMPESGNVFVSDGATLGVTVASSGTTWGGGGGVAGIAGLTAGYGGQTGSTVSFAGNSNLLLNVTTNTTESNAITNGAATSIFLIKIGGSTLTLSGANSYTGVTTITQGTLATNNIANAGSNSGIGAYASSGAAGLVLNGGTFSYTGSTGSTNRGFTLNANSTVNVATAGASLTMGAFARTGTQSLTVSGGSGSSLVLGNMTVASGGFAVTANIATTINGLTFATGTNFDSSGSAAITVNSVNNGGFGITIGGSSNAANTMTGITGSGTLTKSGGGTWRITGSNSYAGATSISNGVLIFDSIANVGGGSSALGAPTTVANGTIGLGNTTGTLNTLRYTGSGTVSSDRVINLRNTGAGAAVLDMSGTGTLTFTSNLTTTNTGTRTFTLTGSTTGIGVIGGVIPNQGTNATSLEKTGSGTWVLSGANTYTGTTTVSAGSLLINGNQTSASGNVSVAANATLGGNGTLGGNTIIADNGRLEFDISTPAAIHNRLDLASGRSLAFSGTSVLTITSPGGAEPGIYTLINAPGGISGIAPATLNLPTDWVATVSIVGNNLVLDVTSVNGTTPGSLEVTAAGGLSSSGYVGGPFSPNSVVYTLSNPGQTTINWTVAKTEDWVTLSATGGTLAGGASSDVTVAIGGTAATLGAGGYNDTVTFTNTTNGTGDTTRSVALSVITLPTYPVNYDGNGNTVGTPPSGHLKTHDVGLLLSGAGTLARAGYTFAGWNTLPDGSGTNYAAGDTYTANAALTLYAQWSPNTYTVTFDANGGGASSPPSQLVTYDSTYGALATVSRSGYTFNGWFTAATGGSQITSGTTVAITAEQTLYAQWTANTYTVTFDANGGDATSPPNQLVTYDSTYGTLAAVSRTGYSFNGWFTAPSGGSMVTSATTVTVAADQTLYAQWSANSYTVIFDANGGDAPSPASKVVTYDAPYGTLATVSRTGYAFNGWFTSAAEGNQVTGFTTVTAAADHTLYAQWTQVFPEMNVTRGVVPVTAGGYDLISGTSPGTGSQLTYTIANSGGDVLSLTDATVSAAGNCSVVIDSQPSGAVARSGSASLAVTVTPTTVGAWSFTVSIANSDPDENPYHWTVHGVTRSTTTTTFTAVADTYINSGATTTNYGGVPNTTFSIWNRSPGNNLRYGLLRFDLSSIPNDAIVTAVSLDFVQSNASSGSVDIYEATGAWLESGVGGATWSDSNTLIGSTSFGTANAPGSTNSSVPSIALNPTGVAKVQSWVQTPAGNHGLGVKTTNAGNNANIDLFTREHGTAGNHPKVTVTYLLDPQVAEMDVARAGSAVADEGTDAVNGSAAGTATQLAYGIANLGNSNLTLAAPVLVSAASNCSVVVDTQPASTVVASTSTNMVVTVTPASGGAWFANLSISNNDSDEAPYNWTISGAATGNYTVSYHANKATSGTVPETQSKTHDVNLTLATNSGDLARTGYTFNGWNTAADGSGSNYPEGATYAVNESVTLYAQWTANTYTVTFDSNGGDAPSPPNQLITYDSTYGTLATVSRSGYTFNGWFTAATGGSQITSGTMVAITADQTLYAQWTANTYTVTFDPNGGDAPSPPNQLVTYDSTYGTLATVSRSGYTFNGWFTAATGGSQITSGTTVAITVDQTLYAQWTANTYTVTFDSNGGDAPSPPNQLVTYDSTYGALATVSRSGYTFNGWFTAATGGSQITSGTTVAITADQTLYAQWTANTYTVTFDPNGGDATSPPNQLVSYDSTYGSLATVSRSGYTFNGWFTAATGGSQITSGTTVAITADQTLYAQWIQNGEIAVTSGDFVSSGNIGGPFSPSSKEYTLENTGGESIGWTAGKTASWVDLSATSGILAAGASTIVTVSVNAGALEPGAYNDIVTFTNTSNGRGDTTRAVKLTVNAMPVARFAIAGMPSHATVGTPVTGITLTALDANDAVATSFTGAVTFGGTAGISGNSANFVAGLLTGVSVTPAVEGVDRTFTVDDGAGHTGTVTFDVLSVYDTWSGGSAMDEDNNGDGVPNGLAWVLGADDPNSDAVALLPRLEPSAVPGFVTYSYRRADAAHNAAGTSIAAEYSTNLTGWQTAVHDGIDVIISEMNEGFGPGIDRVEVSIRENIAPDGRLFLHLKVGRNPP